jgi:transcriptional regulator with XRE-family HTH domain
MRQSVDNAFCVAMREQRRRIRVTQVDLAKRLHWQQSAISKIEAGNRAVSIHEFVSIARALDVSPIELLARVVRYAESGSSAGGSSGRARRLRTAMEDE